MLKATCEFIGIALCFLVWGFILFVAIPVAYAQATDTDRGSYYKNWRTEGGTLEGPIATLPPLDPIPTVDPSEQSDEGSEGSADVSNNRGISYILQMCSANAKEQRKFWNEAYKYSSVWNAGWMYGFTSKQDGCQWSKAFMQMAHPKRVRIHICNCTCFKDRGRTCGANECFPNMTTSQANAAIASHNSQTFKTMNKIIKLAIADAQAAGNTLIDFAVSPCLESGLTAANRKIMMQHVVSKFEDYNAERVAAGLNPIRFVDNPLGDVCLKNRFCEKHGYIKRGAKGIADTDGVSYDDIAQAKYGGMNSKAWMVLAWNPCLNGMKPHATFVPPVSRVDYCSKLRDAPNLAHFTDDNFQEAPSSSSYAQADTKGCSSFQDLNTQKFVWKLGENKNYTTWVTPKGLPVFKSVYLIKNGKKVDESTSIGGRRFGTNYSHEAGRRIYDFMYPLQGYPDNSVLHGVTNSGHLCWKFPKPSFRPNNKEGLVHQN